MWQRTKNIYHLLIAILANFLYSFPSKNLTVVGVTGTDGKTTTTSLIYNILKEAGQNTSMISSVGAIINNKNYDVGFHVTTPSSFALQKFFKRTLNQKNGKKSFMVLETTSHALDQYRVFGIKYDVGVLTNVTHEHLDYHKTYENYVKTKTKLLKMAKVAIVNKDDESYALLSSKFKVQSSKLVTYGMGKDADVNPENFAFKTNLIGEFNKYNVLAAISACKALEISDKDIRKGIASFVPPLGREDIVYDKDFTVMIDFAHTPNAIDQILKSVRPIVKGKIIHVFGSAGARDVTKRPLMGEMSSKYADIIILTAEDPRREPVEKIMNEIAKGIQSSKFKVQNYNSKFKIKDGNKFVLKITDRKKAIKVGIKIAKKDDLVLLTGKSHEKSMNYGHGEVVWDEYETVDKILKIKNQK